jgi:RNA polymerase sigma-70 factor (ECF subfamily)
MTALLLSFSPPRSPDRMPPDRSAEAELVARMAAGDTGAALEAFYQRFAGLVLAVANRILSSRAEAEEVLQEIFFELWRRAPQYDVSRASVTTWVLTVARSRALDARRARARRPSGAGEESAIPPAPDEERPDERALAQQRSKAVHMAMARLTPEQRQALELAYFDGLSHTEIAARLNLPLGTVKSRILSAMKLLRGGLAELQGEFS